MVGVRATTTESTDVLGAAEAHYYVARLPPQDRLPEPRRLAALGAPRCTTGCNAVSCQRERHEGSVRHTSMRRTPESSL
jgi:hypothetical protein